MTFYLASYVHCRIYANEDRRRGDFCTERATMLREGAKRDIIMGRTFFLSFFNAREGCESSQ